MAASTEQISRRVYVKKTTEVVSGLDGNSRKDLRGGANEAGQPGWASILPKAVVCIGCGTLFGIALHKANVMDPIVIRRQMLLEQFTMLKFFMSALASSMLSLSLMAVIPFTSGAFKVAYKDYFDKMTIRSVLSSIVGGSLMGLGMTVSGSCGVSIFPQLGSGVANAQYTFAGAFGAVAVYSLIKPTLDNLFKPAPKSAENRPPWPGSKYFLVSLPIVAALGLFAWGMEKIIPSAEEIKVVSKAGASVMAYNVWPPYCAGTLVGALQLPLVIFMGRTLGGSTSMSCLVAQLFVGPLRNKSHYLEKLRSGFKGTWQVYYALGAVLGGYLSASAAGTLGTSPGVSIPAAFFGGFLLYIGTRIGGGCTSGHGLSGNGLLSTLSYVMIGSTFATAIGSALVFRQLKLI